MAANGMDEARVSLAGTLINIYHINAVMLLEWKLLLRHLAENLIPTSFNVYLTAP